MAKKANGKSVKTKIGKRPQDWTAEEKLEAVLESASLSEAELGEYLRRKGWHEAQAGAMATPGQGWRHGSAAEQAFTEEGLRGGEACAGARAGVAPQGKGPGGDGGTVGA